MSKIFWDTNLFIYLIEDTGERGKQTVHLARRMEERQDELMASTLTLGEVLVKPHEAGDNELCQRYEAILSEHARLISFDEEAAKLYAAIRRDRTIRAPDAIQLACASRASADLFITNDERLSKAVVPGIHFIVSLGRAYI